MVVVVQQEVWNVQHAAAVNVLHDIEPLRALARCLVSKPEALKPRGHGHVRRHVDFHFGERSVWNVDHERGRHTSSLVPRGRTPEQKRRHRGVGAGSHVSGLAHTVHHETADQLEFALKVSSSWRALLVGHVGKRRRRLCAIEEVARRQATRMHESRRGVHERLLVSQTRRALQRVHGRHCLALACVWKDGRRDVRPDLQQRIAHSHGLTRRFSLTIRPKLWHRVPLALLLAGVRWLVFCDPTKIPKTGP